MVERVVSVLIAKVVNYFGLSKIFAIFRKNNRLERQQR
jgi:hypothetical protein